MKLELKNIKLGPGSEETTQFTAKLYVDGKFAGDCDNAGKGGPTDIRIWGGGSQELIDKAEAYCKTLPPLKFSWGEIKMSLEHWVDEQIDKLADAKHLAKEHKRILAQMERDTKRYVVVVSRQNLDAFKSGASQQLPYHTFDYNVPIDRYSDNAKRQIVEQITTKLKDDEFIYNSNLPK